MNPNTLTNPHARERPLCKAASEQLLLRGAHPPSPRRGERLGTFGSTRQYSCAFNDLQPTRRGLHAGWERRGRIGGAPGLETELRDPRGPTDGVLALPLAPHRNCRTPHPILAMTQGVHLLGCPAQRDRSGAGLAAVHGSLRRVLLAVDGYPPPPRRARATDQPGTFRGVCDGGR